MPVAFESKNVKIIYKAGITLLCLFFMLSGFWEITKNPVTYPKTLKMGYPGYFITLLGISKIAGAVLLLLPGLYRLKEWAFAGFVFDVVFAFASGYAISSYADCIKAAIAFFLILFCYFLFHKMEGRKKNLPE